MRHETKIVLLMMLIVIVLAEVLYGIWEDILISQRKVLYISFWAALVEDIVFFSLVGVGVLIYQRYRPESDILRKRVRNLFSGQHESYAALEYNEQQLKKLGAFCRRCQVKITIYDFNRDLSAYRVGFSKSWHIHNMFGDIPYEDEIEVSVKPDPLHDKIDPIGQISSLTLTSGKGRPQELLTTTPVSVPPLPEGFNQKIMLHLERNGEAVYQIHYWLWCKVGIPHQSASRRFVEYLKVDVENKWNNAICISKDEAGEDSVTLSYNDSIELFYLTNIPANQQYRLWFCSPVTDQLPLDSVGN